jgi:hypothetical protein
VPATSLFAITSDGRGTPENSSYMLFATICLGISIDGFTGLDYQRRAYLPIALSGKSREHHVIFSYRLVFCPLATGGKLVQ